MKTKTTHAKPGAEDLHCRMMDRLKEAGWPKRELWLCEGQTWDAFERFYGDLEYLTDRSA
jgi:hypothetical protein